MKAALTDLEQRVSEALTTDDVSAIDVLGYGEISTVLRLTVDGRSYACKRLPPFPAGSLGPYQRACTAYLAALDERGVQTAPSTLETVEHDDQHIVYCIQPIEDTLLVDHLRAIPPEEIGSIAERLTATITGAIDDRLGFDAQISNWALNDSGSFIYIDVTISLISQRAAYEMLDTDLFLASLPAFLRPIVRKFLLGEILSHYYDARASLVDLIGNFKKERLDTAIPAFLDAANGRVDPPITRKEIDGYYRTDAAMWEVLQRLRRTDRWWQRRVRRRGYPFLLPGKVDR